MLIDGSFVRNWLATAAHDLQEAKAYLTQLDAAIGDADHGLNIARGFAAVVEKLDAAGGELDGVLKLTGTTLMSTVGGASGVLYGNFFVRAAAAVAGKQTLDAAQLAAALHIGLEGIIQRGRAAVGDKTMVDSWAPALEALDGAVASGAGLAAALQSAAAAAEAGMNSTLPLVAKKGRASYLGERSAGHLDPGAVSTYILLRALATVAAQAGPEGGERAASG